MAAIWFIKSMNDIKNKFKDMWTIDRYQHAIDRYDRTQSNCGAQYGLRWPRIRPGNTCAGEGNADGTIRPDQIGQMVAGMGKGMMAGFYDTVGDSLKKTGDVPTAEKSSMIGQAWNLVKPHGVDPDVFANHLKAMQPSNKQEFIDFVNEVVNNKRLTDSLNEDDDDAQDDSQQQQDQHQHAPDPLQQQYDDTMRKIKQLEQQDQTPENKFKLQGLWMKADRTSKMISRRPNIKGFTSDDIRKKLADAQDHRGKKILEQMKEQQRQERAAQGASQDQQTPVPNQRGIRDRLNFDEDSIKRQRDAMQKRKILRVASLTAAISEDWIISIAIWMATRPAPATHAKPSKHGRRHSVKAI